MSAPDPKSDSMDVPVAELVGIEARIGMLRLVRGPNGEDTHPSQREARVRVRCALKAFGEPDPVGLGLQYPGDRLPEGADLAVAVGAQVLTGVIPAARLEGRLWFGSVALSGELGAARGLVPALQAAAAEGFTEVIAPACCAVELTDPPPIPVRLAESLGEVLAELRGDLRLPLAKAREEPPPPKWAPDLADIRGLTKARRVLEIAAAGGHPLLLVGPPGAGKTLLARRLPGLLPAMDPLERAELSAIRSATGYGRTPSRERPFRAPHHTASAAAIFGGGDPLRPGEITLAHRGVLFLDELSEFPRGVLEPLGGVLERGLVHRADQRRRQGLTLPAQALLVGSMEPYLSEDRGSVRAWKRVAPLVGGVFELQAVVEGQSLEELAALPASEPSAVVAERVRIARDFGAAHGPIEPSPAAVEVMGEVEEGRRGKVLRVARTLARMEQVSAIGEAHLLEADALVPRIPG